MFYERGTAGGDEGDAHGRGTFEAYEQVVGSVGGHDGSFVLRQRGTFAGPDIRAELHVVEGSGTGDLSGLTGTGEYRLTMGEPAATYTFDYDVGS